METPQTEKLREFYKMVAPHLVAHRTAHNLFWDTVHELEERENHIKYLLDKINELNDKIK